MAINSKGGLVASRRTPILDTGGRREYDIPEMLQCIQYDVAHEYGEIYCGIEKVGTMPRDGRVGAFNFGKGYGIWLGLLAATRTPYAEIQPQRWQSKMLAGLARGPQTKVSAVTAAKSLFPDLPIKVKADWGMADAVLIAEYARRQRQGVK